jgi:hypothetical protein
MAHCGGKKLPRSLPFPLNRDEGDEQFALKRCRFNYMFTINTNIDFFKGYLYTTHDDKASSRFTIHYYKSQWKRNNLSIIVVYVNFNMKRLKLTYLKLKKNKRLKSLD